VFVARMEQMTTYLPKDPSAPWWQAAPVDYSVPYVRDPDTDIKVADYTKRLLALDPNAAFVVYWTALKYGYETHRTYQVRCGSEKGKWKTNEEVERLFENRHRSNGRDYLQRQIA